MAKRKLSDATILRKLRVVRRRCDIGWRREAILDLDDIIDELNRREAGRKRKMPGVVTCTADDGTKYEVLTFPKSTFQKPKRRKAKR